MEIFKPLFLDGNNHKAANFTPESTPLFNQHNQPAALLPNIIARVFMSLFAGVANLATIVAFLTDSGMRARPSNLIFLSLAIADFGTGVIMLPLLTTSNALQKWPFGGIVGCKAFIFFESTFLASGILHLLLLTWDRYKLLRKNYPAYVTGQTRKALLRAVLLTWIFSLIPGIIELSSWDYNLAAILKNGIRVNYDFICVPPSTRRLNYALSFNLVFRLLPVILILMFGVLIVIGLYHQIKHWKQIQPSIIGQNIHFQDSSSERNTVEEARRRHAPINRLGNNFDHKMIGRRYIKPIVTYIVLLLLLVLCTLPLGTYVIIVNSFCRSCFGRQYILYWVNLMYFNSCVNPIAVMLTNRRVRLFYLRCINALCGKR